MIIGKAKSFYNGLEITENCTFFGGWLQNLGTI
jgi:hypothetical protein